MQPPDKFLSCDWGTSLLRLRLVRVADFTILGEENSSLGIAETFKQWKQSEKDEEGRVRFYLDIIYELVKKLEQKLNTSLNALPLIISGMASSTLGMVELSYKEIPFSINGCDLNVETIDIAERLNNNIVLVSGAKTDEDVMRGEETQLVGCTVNDEIEQVFIFPGTHSKHVEVKNGEAVNFKTYMTGEFFELLSKKSILSVSVNDGGNLNEDSNLQSFRKGVNDGMQFSLLQTCFLVRTNDLFSKYTKKENYFYLSGLLIGYELKDVINKELARITVISDSALIPFYEAAFDEMCKERRFVLQKSENAAQALIRGQYKIFSCLKKSK